MNMAQSGSTLGKKRVIVALDVPERERALALVRLLKDEMALCKIGLEGFVAHGPDFVREIVALGVEVFLDLKLHDIPRTAAAAAREAAKLQVSLLTIHAAGGAEMIKAVKAEIGTATKVIAVTVLTSLDEQMVRDIGFIDPSGELSEPVIPTLTWRLGQLALASGADGLVSSAHELKTLSTLPGLRVVPGVRLDDPATRVKDDQARVATPLAALQAGATWLVIGRPILQAADPLRALQAINTSLNMEIKFSGVI